MRRCFASCVVGTSSESVVCWSSSETSAALRLVRCFRIEVPGRGHRNFENDWRMKFQKLKENTASRCDVFQTTSRTDVLTVDALQERAVRMPEVAEEPTSYNLNVPGACADVCAVVVVIHMVHSKDDATRNERGAMEAGSRKMGRCVADPDWRTSHVDAGFCSPSSRRLAPFHLLSSSPSWSQSLRSVVGPPDVIILILLFLLRQRSVKRYSSLWLGLSRSAIGQRRCFLGRRCVLVLSWSSARMPS